jgi:hypothetical protein
VNVWPVTGLFAKWTAYKIYEYRDQASHEAQLAPPESDEIKPSNEAQENCEIAKNQQRRKFTQ